MTSLLLYFVINACRTNNTEDYVVEQSSGLHVDNISKVSGKELFKDSQYMVNSFFPSVDFLCC